MRYIISLSSWEEPKFIEKHIRHKKKPFDENIDNEIVKSLRESFRIDFFFLYIVDKKITTQVDLNNLKYMKIFFVFYVVLKIKVVRW